MRRGVAAWAEAVDGDDAAFAHLAQPRLLQELLYPPSPGRSLRLVVRAPVVRRVTFVDLDADASPGHGDRAHGAGGRALRRGPQHADAGRRVDKDGTTRFDGTWTLALDGSPDVPWRIAAVRDDRPEAGGAA